MEDQAAALREMVAGGTDTGFDTAPNRKETNVTETNFNTTDLDTGREIRVAEKQLKQHNARCECATCEAARILLEQHGFGVDGVHDDSVSDEWVRGYVTALISLIDRRHWVVAADIMRAEHFTIRRLKFAGISTDDIKMIEWALNRTTLVLSDPVTSEKLDAAVQAETAQLEAALQAQITSARRG